VAQAHGGQNPQSGRAFLAFGGNYVENQRLRLLAGNSLLPALSKSAPQAAPSSEVSCSIGAGGHA